MVFRPTYIQLTVEAIRGVLRKRLKLAVTSAAGADGIRVYRIGAA